MIVESAVRTFAKYGFHGSTTKRLARDAAVSEGLIYRYFSSKEEVYQAVLELLVESSPRFEVSDRDGHQIDRQLLLSFARKFYEYFGGQPQAMRVLLFSALQGDGISKEYFNRSMRTTYATIIERVGSGQRSGHYRSDVVPQVAARSFVGMLMYHIIVQSLVEDPYQPVEAVDWIRGFVDIFLQGIEARLDS